MEAGAAGAGMDYDEEEDYGSEYQQMGLTGGLSGFGAGDNDLAKKRKKKKKKKKKKPAEYEDPSLREHLLAGAYGGVAKPKPKRQNIRQTTNIDAGLRDLATPASAFMRDPSRQNMQSYSGFANIAGAESARGGGKRTYGASGGARGNRSSYGGRSDVGSNIGSRMGGTSTKNLDPQQREALLKKRQMDEIQRKKAAKEKAQGGKGAKFSKDEDFEKLFGQDVEKFLDDSEWDIDSIDKLSYLSKGSKGSVRSASQAGKLRGLEKLYLQRIETSVNKNTL
jgi:hypothetical protein